MPEQKGKGQQPVKCKVIGRAFVNDGVRCEVGEEIVVPRSRFDYFTDKKRFKEPRLEKVAAA